jgi:hypothetical protein
MKFFLVTPPGGFPFLTASKPTLHFRSVFDPHQYRAAVFAVIANSAIGIPGILTSSLGRAAMLQSIITIPSDLLWLAVAFAVVMAGMLAAAPE